MNRLFLIIALILILITPQAWGATSPYPNPYRQTMWNNLTDSIHTIGQSPQQAKLTKKRLHNQRTGARIKNMYQARRNKRGW